MVGLFIRNARFLITVDEKRRIIKDGAVAIEGNKIAAVGKTEDLLKEYRDSEQVIDASKMIVVPGFVNCHHHSPYSFLRSLGDNLDLPTFIVHRTRPMASILTKEEGHIAATAVLLESIKNGTTMIADTGEGQVDGVPDAIEKTGIRAVVGKSVLDIPKIGHNASNKLEDRTEKAIGDAKEFYEKHDGRGNGRLRVWFSPSHERSVSDRLVKELSDMALQNGVGWETHVAASNTSVLEHKENFHGKGAIERFAELGALGPHFMAVHANWISDEELELICKHDVRVCHNPTSGVAGGFGTFSRGKFVEMMQRGVTVALGSDNVARSNHMDMLRVAQATAVHRDVREDPTLFPPETLLEMLTINGAKTLLREDETGSIEEGKKADIILFRIDLIEWQPLYNPVSNLIQCANGSSVDTSIIDGKVVMENRAVKTVNESEVVGKIEEVSEGILGRAGLERYAKGRWEIE